MDALEQHLFALELIVTSRLAMDTPETRRQLASAIADAPADCGPIEAAIRRRALAIVRSADGPDVV